MHSYQKQIERLLKFVNEVAQDESCIFSREAKELLNDEPINLTTYGLLESPERTK